VWVLGGGVKNLPPPPERETSANKGEDAGAPQRKSFIGTARPDGLLAASSRDASAGRAAPKYLRHPGEGCKELSQGPQAAVDAPAGTVPLAEGLGAELQREMGPPKAVTEGSPQAPGKLCSRPVGLGTVPSSKALPRPVQSTCWEHWASPGDGGMRGGLASSCEEKGREGRRDGRGAGKRDGRVAMGSPAPLWLKRRKKEIK